MTSTQGMEGPTDPGQAPRRNLREALRNGLLFGRLARWVLDQPRAWALALVLVTVVGALLASRLKVDPDMLKLLPTDDPGVQALLELDKQEGGVNVLTISVSGPDQPTVDAYLADLQTRVEALPEVRYAMWGVDPALGHRIAILQLTVEELKVLRDRLRAAIALGPAASNPFIASRLLDMGPLTEKLAHGGEKLTFATAPNTGRLLVRPAGSSHEMTFARRFMTDVNRVIAESDPAARGVEIAWIGGPYRHNIEDMDGISHDLGWTSGASFLLISLAILLFYRDWRALVIIMVPQAVGSAWTLGFARMTVGTLNLFTSFAVAVLVGLGNDYAIVLYSRYREQRGAGLPMDEAIVAAWSRSGGPAFTAALTSAAGFLSLLAASFNGFQQLGIVIGAGIPLCFLAVLTLCPLLIRWTNAGGSLPFKAASAHAADRGLPLDRRYPLALPILLVTVLVTSVAGWSASRVQFDFDLSNIRRQGLGWEDLDEQAQALVQASYSPVVVSYDTQAALDQDHALIQEEIAAGRFPEVARVLSIRSVIPVDAEARGAVLAEIAELGRNPAVRYLPPVISRNLQRLVEREEGKPFALREEDLPPALLAVLGASAGRYRMLLIPSGNMWDIRECARLRDAVNGKLPGRSVAGEYVSIGLLYQLIRTDGPLVVALAFSIVALLMFLDMRRLSRMAWPLVVQVVGLVWGIGLMPVLGIKFNIVNLVGVPICMGTGIETAILLKHRLEEEGVGGIRRALLTTGLASSMCALTTLLAFASLILAESRGIRSLGEFILEAEAMVAICAFVVLPAGAALAYKLGRERTLPDEAK